MGGNEETRKHNPLLSDDRPYWVFIPQQSKTIEVCLQTIRYLSCVHEQN